MRWTNKFFLMIATTLIGTFTMMVIATSVFEWLYNPETIPVEENNSPPTDLLSDEDDGILIGESKADYPYELDPRKGKLNFFERITESGESTRRNLGLFVALLALGCLSFYIYLKRKRRVVRARDHVDSNADQLVESLQHENASSVSTLTAFTNVPIRDALITFNQSLVPAKRLRAHETLQEWFRRIDLPMNPSVYHAVRYGTSSGVTISEEDTLHFKNTLDSYTTRPHPE
ncbi:hypothetical protein PJK55_10550 [Exiguobacterium sp. MMG028]|uniref:hypothetical protein n=1 Tax=Exiguobacterium sp. MMG028 TaxID=3021979 RepID=UPI0022FE405E|nr:hypothetical protein [Exiguobacterium sp. MMG028]MDA5561174.1 hypothetical protein [Exiguobacterium sp. MMG028]